jgi:hypothetical protein
MPNFAKLRDARLYLFAGPRLTSSRKGIVMLGVAAAVLAAGALVFVGATPVVVGCILLAGVVIVLAIRRAKKRDTEVIFAFYVAADEVLRDSERKRYRFEVADVIQAGEKIVRSFPDPPPLGTFALGALYNLIDDHNAVVEYLGIAAEEEMLKDSTHASPSRKLRRYVKRLRQIERFPERWPKLYAAMTNLERLHQERGARMLASSQQHLTKMIEAYENGSLAAPALRLPVSNFASRSLRSINPPPPISEVLNDVYQEEPAS